MKITHKLLEISTVSNRPSYHDLLEEIHLVIEENGIQDGIVVFSTPHTTCSFIFEETMHDQNFYGDDFLHVDINNIMENIIPKMTTENQYHSPGPKHIEFGLSLSDPNYPAEKWVMLNTDAHIRASICGTNSQTIIIKEGKPLIGSLGRLYFIDWDQLRERIRTVNILVMGD